MSRTAIISNGQDVTFINLDTITYIRQGVSEETDPPEYTIVSFNGGRELIFTGHKAQWLNTLMTDKEVTVGPDPDHSIIPTKSVVLEWLTNSLTYCAKCDSPFVVLEGEAYCPDCRKE